ncbi:MAG: hypothetical protein ABR552_11765 [Actinomycetota bacterium]
MRRALLAFCLVIVSLSPLRPSAASGDTYLVGAATRNIDPTGVINLGGFGLGDGTVIPDAVAGRGNRGSHVAGGDSIAARAIVFDDGTTAVALVSVETQGMFAAYERSGKWGLHDIEARVAHDIPRLPISNVVISNDHTHSGPDAIGAWGFLPDSYMDYIADQTAGAIEDAYAARTQATLVAGASSAPDIVYNQNCTEALNQSGNTGAPNDVCNPGLNIKDSLVRVIQARDASGAVTATLMSYGAHSTLGGGNGVAGDWPQYISDALTARYHSVGIGMEGTNGGVQPCRPRCGFTDPNQPGYAIGDRKSAYTTMLMAHIDDALAHAVPVTGPVSASKAFIRHEVENPFLTALLLDGGAVGAPIQRSTKSPWLTGNVVQTVVSAIRIGSVLVSGSPGETYPNIAADVAAASGVDPSLHWTLSLTDDQLGYLIAHTESYPPVLAEVYVNDNSIFNVSPTIGDHVMCTQVRLAA